MGVGESYGAVDAELPKGKPQVRESGVGHPFGRKALGRREGESSTLDLLRTAVNQALCSSLSDLKSSQPPQSHQFRPSIPRCAHRQVRLEPDDKLHGTPLVSCNPDQINRPKGKRDPGASPKKTIQI